MQSYHNASYLYFKDITSTKLLYNGNGCFSIIWNFLIHLKHLSVFVNSKVPKFWQNFSLFLCLSSFAMLFLLRFQSLYCAHSIALLLPGERLDCKTCKLSACVLSYFHQFMNKFNSLIYILWVFFSRLSCILVFVSSPFLYHLYRFV